MQSERNPRNKMLSTAALVLITTVIVWAETPLPPGEDGGESTVTLHLVDPDGQPVAGAQVGRYAQTPDKPILGRKVFFQRSQSSDEQGKVTLDLTGNPGARPPRRTGLYILHEERRLTAFHEVLREHAEAEKEIRVPLEPACYVHGTLASAGLRAIGWPLSWSNAYLSWGRYRSLSCSSERQRVEFWVAPGKYELWAYGSGRNATRDLPHFVADTANKTITITIEAGQAELDLGVMDLPPGDFASLMGKPAPELDRIKGWKNGGPVTLAQLRGKFVVLDFWGYWCGPCLRAMPKLMDLYDAFDSKDLVIIAVHNDSVASIEEMEAKLQKARQTYWEGRDLPFLVALDGSDPAVEGTERPREDTTTAAYGIRSYPTTILIDRQGNVVGEMNLFRGKEILRQMLDAEPEH